MLTKDSAFSKINQNIPRALSVQCRANKENKNLNFFQNSKPKQIISAGKTQYFFYNELILVKKIHNNKNNMKKIIIVHMELLIKTGKKTSEINNDLYNFLKISEEENLIIFILPENQNNSDFSKTLTKASSYDYVYQIKRNKSSLFAGNLVLDYSKIFCEQQYKEIEQIIIMKPHHEIRKIDKNFVFSENQLCFFNHFPQIFKCYYFRETFFEKNNLHSILEEFSNEIINFDEVYTAFKEKYLEKLNNLVLIQKMHEFKKKQINVMPAIKSMKEFDDFFKKKQIKIRKNFFDFLLELKKYPKTKNLVIGPVIDSLLERNNHIFLHINKFENEKKEQAELFLDHFSLIKSKEIQENMSVFDEFEKFSEAYYHKNLYLL